MFKVKEATIRINDIDIDLEAGEDGHLVFSIGCEDEECSDRKIETYHDALVIANRMYTYAHGERKDTIENNIRMPNGDRFLMANWHWNDIVSLAEFIERMF